MRLFQPLVDRHHHPIAAAVGRLRARLPLLRPWLPAGVAIVLSVFVAVFIGEARQERHRHDLLADFSFESRELGLRLQDRMVAYRQVLRGARSVFSSVGFLSKDEWAQYVSNLYLDIDFPGIRGIGYVSKVSPDKRAAHLERMQANGYPLYRIWPDGEAESPLPIVRLAPASEANDRLIGLNLGTSAGLGETLAQSAVSAQARLSPPSTLLSPDPAEPAGSRADHVFFFQPIYDASRREASADGTGPDRGRALTGWMFGLFQPSELVNATLGTLPRNMSLKIYSGDRLTADRLIHDSTIGQPVTWQGAVPLRVVMPLLLDGQTWTLVFEGFPRAYANQTAFNGEWLAILIICLLFSLSALLMTRARASAVRLHNLSVELQASNERYQFLATHDALTRVANRFLFQERLTSTLAQASRYGRAFALIYIDLDHFKSVNDHLGHHIGDLLLIDVTRRLQALLRDTDLLARRGGDEFVVLLPEVESIRDAERLADRICVALARPFALEGHSVDISGSLGLSAFPQDGAQAEPLVNAADHRMYVAKQQGRNRWISEGMESIEA